MTAAEIATAAGMFLVAVLYSFVGHGGASGYLAVLSLTTLVGAAISATALALNLVVAGISFIAFAQGRHFSWPLTWPYLVLAVPCSYFGSSIELAPAQYSGVLGAVLAYAAVMLFWHSAQQEDVHAPPFVAALASGAAIGVVSGMVGVGGGIFLSPLILLLRWGSAKATAATSAVFIVANSLAGLGEKYSSSSLELSPQFPMLAVLCAAGALVGSRLGARKAPPVWIRIVLGLVLCTAAVKHGFVFFESL
ncbi:MAG: TSUP family transporter [Fimbriimonadaceae bacterium]